MNLEEEKRLSASSRPVTLDVKGLSVHYLTRTGMVRAVEDVNFQLRKQEALGIVGESGCGKSTLVLGIMRLVPQPGKIVAGKIRFNRVDLLSLSEKDICEIRGKRISLIYQGAIGAFNPVYRIEDQIAEAILAHEEAKAEEAKQRARELLLLVHLDPSWGRKFPHELSGGMKQRAMIAMATALNPDIVIADEPTTALDVLIQRQIMDLLAETRSRLHASMILISHDLAMVSETCDRIAVMYAGRFVESAPSRKLIENPAHPYTQGLIESTPMLLEERTRPRAIPGLPPDLRRPISGCPFLPRCEFAMEICKAHNPELVGIGRDHEVACWIHRASN